MMPGLKSAGGLRAGDRQGALRRRPDRARRRRGPLHSPRTRSSSSRRTSRCSTPSSPTRTRSTRRSRRCSTSSTTTSRSTAHTTLGDIDAAFAKADRVVRASIWVHRHQPVPMECRGLIADWDDDDAEHLTIHASTQSPHMFRMLLPSQINVPDGADPGARRRRRRRVRAEEQRRARGGRRRRRRPSTSVGR